MDRRSFLMKLFVGAGAVTVAAVPLPQLPKEPKGKLVIDGRETLPVVELQANYATGNWYNVQAMCTKRPDSALIGAALTSSVVFTTPDTSSSGRGYMRSVEPVDDEGRRLYKVKLYVRDWAVGKNNG